MVFLILLHLYIYLFIYLFNFAKAHNRTTNRHLDNKHGHNWQGHNNSVNQLLWVTLSKPRPCNYRKLEYLARVQAHRGKNSGPASKTRYFVLSAFAHERSILIGCLLLDSIIRSVIHHKGSR
jgi:hypothetical protein